MEGSTVAIIIAGGGFALTVILQVGGGSWRLSGKLADMEKGLRQAISDSTKDVEEKQERATHDFGETISALKEHIRQLEMFVRDRYVEKNDFAAQMQRHNELLQMNFTNISQRLDRMEKKMDVR